jgi:hypothetical protein
MNTISKTHKRFSERLRNPRVLENPEEFLGENFEAVLNFWLILDDLSEEQWRVINERYDDFYNEKYYEWLKTADLAWDASKEVVGVDYTIHVGCVAYAVTKYALAIQWTTRELIAMHKILENHQQPLTFFPMFLDLI